MLTRTFAGNASKLIAIPLMPRCLMQYSAFDASIMPSRLFVYYYVHLSHLHADCTCSFLGARRQV